jgi:hypothetical protein
MASGGVGGSRWVRGEVFSHRVDFFYARAYEFGIGFGGDGPGVGQIQYQNQTSGNEG